MPEYYISSTKCTIQERQTKKNGKVYDVVFRIVTLDGEEKQKKLSGFKTKSAAKAAHAQFVTEKCELVKNNPLKKKKTASEQTVPTVGELFAEYLKSIDGQVKYSSIYDKEQTFKKWILPKYQNVPITALTREELYKWQDELWAERNERTGERYGYEYLSKIRAHFSSFLSWTESRKGFRNEFEGVTRPKRRGSNRETTIWTRAQFEAFIAIVDDPIYKALFETAFFTGRRKGELFALRRADFDERTKTLLVNKSLTKRAQGGAPYAITTTKADKSQRLPLCEKAYECLKKHKEETKHHEGTGKEESEGVTKTMEEALFLFSRDGGKTPLNDSSMQRAFGEYIKKANEPKIRFHDLRHSYVSMLIHLGANYTVIADLIGDTVEQVTKTYGHMYESDKLHVLSLIK